MTAVIVDGAEARVTFDQFDADAYELFLRCKRLPESDLAYDWQSDSYTVTTAARYAPMLGADLTATAAAAVPLASHLFDYQRWTVERALDARRYAIWADTGLGKTAMFLEWARQVACEGPVLILSPLQIVDQTIEEAARFYGKSLPIQKLTRRSFLERWLEQPDGVAIANTEKVATGDPLKLRRLTGLVLDEASILKTGGGKTKWALIHQSRGVPFKLSCTATPAPNDTMEYASQAAFLERLRHEGEILWTWFARDKRGVWRVKPHGLKDFYRFMASWSIYMRDPAAYGFEPILDSLPDPVVHEHHLELTPEQRAAADELLVHTGRGLFDERLGVRERAKFAQLARGFLYQDGGAVRVPSRKPALVAELARAEVDAGRPTLVWTNFDEESRLLHELLPDAAMLHGDTPDDHRGVIVEAFRHGGIDLLISKPQLLGLGLNLQRCRAMVFSGIDDSFERFYQAVRRAYRFGQTETVHVHLPVVPELEGLMLTNLQAKQQRFAADVTAQEQHYINATRDGAHG
jgi:hypothetical protein